MSSVTPLTALVVFCVLPCQLGKPIGVERCWRVAAKQDQYYTEKRRYPLNSCRAIAFVVRLRSRTKFDSE
jgi:hypothetical protein